MVGEGESQRETTADCEHHAAQEIDDRGAGCYGSVKYGTAMGTWRGRGGIEPQRVVVLGRAHRRLLGEVSATSLRLGSPGCLGAIAAGHCHISGRLHRQTQSSVGNPALRVTQMLEDWPHLSALIISVSIRAFLTAFPPPSLLK